MNIKALSLAERREDNLSGVSINAGSPGGTDLQHLHALVSRTRVMKMVQFHLEATCHHWSAVP